MYSEKLAAIPHNKMFYADRVMGQLRTCYLGREHGRGLRLYHRPSEKNMRKSLSSHRTFDTVEPYCTQNSLKSVLAVLSAVGFKTGFWPF